MKQGERMSLRSPARVIVHRAGSCYALVYRTRRPAPLRQWRRRFLLLTISPQLLAIAAADKPYSSVMHHPTIAAGISPSATKVYA